MTEHSKGTHKAEQDYQRGWEYERQGKRAEAIQAWQAAAHAGSKAAQEALAAYLVPGASARDARPPRTLIPLHVLLLTVLALALVAGSTGFAWSSALSATPTPIVVVNVPSPTPSATSSLEATRRVVPSPTALRFLLPTWTPYRPTRRPVLPTRTRVPVVLKPTTQPTPEMGFGLPPGYQLAYTAKDAGYAVDIFLTDSSGTVKRLTDGSGDKLPFSWSPDGQQIIYSAWLDGRAKLYTMDAYGGNQRLLTEGENNEFCAEWSPDGRTIAFLSYRDADADLYLMNSDGSGISQFSTTIPIRSCVRWSPDGSQLIFGANQDGDFDIYVVDVAGTTLTRLTNFPGDEYGPAFSPDGRQIAFSSVQDGMRDLYLMDLDGTITCRLTQDIEEDYTPTWSPDGAWISFMRRQFERGELWVIRSDGSELRQVTNTEDTDVSSAVWRPFFSEVAMLPTLPPTRTPRPTNTRPPTRTPRPTNTLPPTPPPVAGGSIRFFRIQPDLSEARFRIEADLRGQRVTIVGATQQLSGEIMVNYTTPGKSVVGPIQISLRTLVTANAFQDRALRSQILQADQPEYEFAVFSPKRLAGLPKSVTFGEAFAVFIVGDLTLHGLTREVSFTGRVTPLSPEAMMGSASGQVRYADFGLSIPTVPGVDNVAEYVTLEIDFTALQSEATAFSATEVPPTEVPTLTRTPTETPTQTPTLTHTPTEMPTQTPTLARTLTEMPTQTPTLARTLTEMPTQTPTPTRTPTGTPTRTPTQTPTPAITADLRAFEMVFAADMGDGQLDLYIQDGNGDNRRAISDTPEIEILPFWSPDGTQITYARFDAGVYQLYLTDAQGSQPRALTSGGDLTICGAWSPDGTTIAFVRWMYGAAGLYFMDSDFSNERLITPLEGFGSCPIWSPDGQRLVMSRKLGDNHDLWTLATDGSDWQQLTNGPTDEVEPDWSPDGMYIVYRVSDKVEDNSPNSDIYIMSADGSAPMLLYDGRANSPVWSPDGLWLSFVVVEAAENTDIWLVRPDGSGLHGLETPNTNEYMPRWRPVAAQGTGNITPGATKARPSATPLPCVLSVLRAANMRSGPGTSFAVVGGLEAGQSVRAVSQTKDSRGMVWYKVESGGWVRTDLVRASHSCTALPQGQP